MCRVITNNSPATYCRKKKLHTKIFGSVPQSSVLGEKPWTFTSTCGLPAMWQLALTTYQKALLQRPTTKMMSQEKHPRRQLPPSKCKSQLYRVKNFSQKETGPEMFLESLCSIQRAMLKKAMSRAKNEALFSNEVNKYIHNKFYECCAKGCQSPLQFSLLFL